MTQQAPESERSAPRSQRGERPEFDKRLLNIYLKHDGVHAFIRDTAIGAHQARQVARAISKEIATAGHALAELTVNGRRIDRAGHGFVGAGDGDAMASGEPAAGPAVAPFSPSDDTFHRLFSKGTPT